MCQVVHSALGFALPPSVPDHLHQSETEVRETEDGVVGGFRSIDEQEWLSFSEATSPRVRKTSLRGLGFLR
ncbi:hypothetical protein ACVDFE_24910 [Lentzea chajnantorensis]